MPNPRVPTPKNPATFTLRDVVEGRFMLVFQCAGCGKVAQVDPLTLVAQSGPECLLETVRFKARCTRCGKRRARPFLRDPVKPEVHAWWPHNPGGWR